MEGWCRRSWKDSSLFGCFVEVSEFGWASPLRKTDGESECCWRSFKWSPSFFSTWERRSWAQQRGDDGWDDGIYLCSVARWSWLLLCCGNSLFFTVCKRVSRVSLSSIPLQMQIATALDCWCISWWPMISSSSSLLW